MSRESSTATVPAWIAVLDGATRALRLSMTVPFAILWLSMIGCDANSPDADDSSTPPTPSGQTASATEATPVGMAPCAECHPAEAERWRGSHHDLAMQPATPETILGDFGGTSFEDGGGRFEFREEDGRFFVRTAGADGQVTEFEISHAFGIDPLQQYLVPLPDGRLQALSVAWDTRPQNEGGQRWFDLRPGESNAPGDVLHWTGPAYNWNTMCADCHSTGFEKNYQLETDRYASSWEEVDVTCEACHGPGSEHVAWARSGDPQPDPNRGLVVPPAPARSWRFTPEDPIARRVPEIDDAGRAEIETCAPCHARRSRIAEGAHAGSAFLDHYRPALLDEGLYFPDGQILDEVYVWGSFLQSRMHAEGVVCSDCHDPHSLRIDAPDATCAGCHDSATFASPTHHRHEADSAGSSCVACHMPARTYMVNDDRRDHGFRIPRPDLSEKIGTPDACTGCHTDQTPDWAAQAVTRWRGSDVWPPHPGEVIAAGRTGGAGADRALSELARDETRPAIVRATAVQLLGRSLSREAIPGLLAGLESDEPLLRMAAAGASEALPAQDRWLALSPLLDDPLRAVRIEAARALAPLRAQRTDAASRSRLDAALREYRAAQEIESDRPSALVNLGILELQLGRIDEAIRLYEEAIRIGPYFVPAYINLADAYRVAGREQEGEQTLRGAIERNPHEPDLQHTFGLLLIRTGRTPEGLAALEAAAAGAPENPRYAYVYGIGLHSVGRTDDALRFLSSASERHPGSRDILLALATIYRDQGRPSGAIDAARRLVELNPQDAEARAFLRQLETALP